MIENGACTKRHTPAEYLALRQKHSARLATNQGFELAKQQEEQAANGQGAATPEKGGAKGKKEKRVSTEKENPRRLKTK